MSIDFTSAVAVGLPLYEMNVDCFPGINLKGWEDNREKTVTDYLEEHNKSFLPINSQIKLGYFTSDPDYTSTLIITSYYESNSIRDASIKELNLDEIEASKTFFFSKFKKVPKVYLNSEIW